MPRTLLTNLHSCDCRAVLGIKDLCSYEENKARHGKPKTNKGFNEGMQEIEMDPMLTGASLPPLPTSDHFDETEQLENLAVEEMKLEIVEPQPAATTRSGRKSAAAKATPPPAASRKRKRESLPPPMPSPVESLPDRVSRSGRQIKRPRYADDDDHSSVVSYSSSTMKSPAAATETDTHDETDQEGKTEAKPARPTRSARKEPAKSTTTRAASAKRASKRDTAKDETPQVEEQVAEPSTDKVQEAAEDATPDLGKVEKIKQKIEEKERLKEQLKLEKMEKKVRFDSPRCIACTDRHLCSVFNVWLRR